MKQTCFNFIAWWFDLITPWRGNTLTFFINERGDLQGVSDDDAYNFEVCEDDDTVAEVLLGFPSEGFSTWLRSNVGGLKMSRVYTVDFEVSPSGKVRFDLQSFKASSWAPKVV